MDKSTILNFIYKLKNFVVIALFLIIAILIDGVILCLYHYNPCSKILDRLSSGEVLASILITFPTIATWISESNQKRSADILSNYKLRESSFSEQYSNFLNNIDLDYKEGEMQQCISEKEKGQNECRRNFQNDDSSLMFDFKSSIIKLRDALVRDKNSRVEEDNCQNNQSIYCRKQNYEDSRLMVELQSKRIKLKDFLQREGKLKEEAKDCKGYRYENLIDFVSLYLFLQTYLSAKINSNNEALLWREQIFKPILERIKDNNESEEIKSLYHSDKINTIFCIDFSGKDVTDKLLSIPTDKQSAVIFDYCYFTTESITQLIESNESLLDTDEDIVMNNCAFEKIDFQQLFKTNEGIFPVQINSYYKDGVLTKKNFKSRGK